MAVLNGTASADTLTATTGPDTITGGVGDDTFVVTLSGGGHTDVILDFGTQYFAGSITREQEVGQPASPGSGSYTGALRKGGGAFDFSATITGLDLGGQTAATSDNVTASHFHLGQPGVNGGVVFGYIGAPNNDLDGDTVVNAAAGTFRGQWDAGEGNSTTLTAQLAALKAGGLYLNVHTTANAGGEIRGQVLAADQGNDKIDLRGTGVADFNALNALITEVNGSAQLNLTSGGQTYVIVLQNVPKAALSASDFIFGAGGGGPTVPPAVLSAFSNIHLGRSPTTAETAALVTAGNLSGAAQNKAIVDTADNDTAVAVQTYQFFTNATPSAAGLAFLTNSAASTNDLNDPYYAQFNIENRYINFAANLGVFGDGAAAFNAAYGSLTFGQAVQKAYEAIIGLNYAAQAGINAAAGIADITSRVAYFQGVAQAGLPAASVSIGTKAAMVGYIMAEGIKADVGAYAIASNAFMTDYLDGTAVFNINLIGSAYLPTAPTGSPTSNPNTDPGTPTTPTTPVIPTTPTMPSDPYDYYYYY